MRIHIAIFVILCLCLNVSVLNAQKGNSVIKKADNRGVYSELKDYQEVISEHAETQKGLFTFHKVGGKYYFEIPESLLEKEILVATKVSGHVQSEDFAYGAGSQPRSQQVIRFQRKDDCLLMRLVTYNSVANKELPIYQSVKKNNFEAVIYIFKIEAINKVLPSYVIDVKDFFTSDISIIGGLRYYERGAFGISGVDKSRSTITKVNAFAKNVEVRHILTYQGSKLPVVENNLISLELNQSFILLPENPLVPRFYDERIGFFSIEQIDYGLNEQESAVRKYILRRRLEPSDWNAYNRGDLVDPVKPIVYYIDPATPLRWRKYIKQGVEAWQKAFEKIGFKNAILAKDPPTPEEDPDWNPEDIRYSVIRYAARTNRGANGPNIHDPRTGEILESDILFNHNMMKLLRTWFFVRTSAINPDARSIKLKDEVMGKLIQGVITHEVGHTLGQMHNPISHRAYPVDSLRSPIFTSKYGSGESIMDFTYNYLAQPGDGVTNFYNQLSEYDYWAIQYGYRPIPNVNSPAEEEYILNKWIVEKAGNPIYMYGNKFSLLGRDQIMAAKLGIKNLKHIMKNLVDWSVEEGKGYELLSARYEEIIREFQNYMSSISLDIGGVNDYIKILNQKDPAHKYVSFDTQKKAIDFLNNQLFSTPYWLVDQKTLGLIGIKKWNRFNNPLKGVQHDILDNLMYSSKKMLENRLLYDLDGYSILNLFSDLRMGIFSEITRGEPIDSYRRDLQKTMVNHFENFVNSEDPLIKNSDIPSVARANLITLAKEIRSGMFYQTDNMSRYHLQDLLVKINGVLNINTN